MFAKIFTQILDSSIARDWQLRHAFEDMLILADKDGIVDMTLDSLARRTNKPEELWKGWIEKLLAPDLDSRNPREDGRRIKKLDENRTWGWKIINYEHYRLIASEEQRKANQRAAFHRWKDKKNSNQNSPANAALIPANDANTNKPSLENFVLTPDQPQNEPPQSDPKVSSINTPNSLEIKDANAPLIRANKNKCANAMQRQRQRYIKPPYPPCGAQVRRGVLSSECSKLGKEFSECYEFVSMVEKWEDHCRENKNRITKSSAKQAVSEFIKFGPEASIQAISKSLAANWRGIVFDACKPQNPPKTTEIKHEKGFI